MAKPILNQFLDDTTATLDYLDLDPDLSNFDRNVTVVDGNGNPTTITYTRPNSTLYMTRVYSNADSNGFYQTCVETYKDIDGTTTVKTYTFTLTFLTNGIIDTCTKVVS